MQAYSMMIAAIAATMLLLAVIELFVTEILGLPMPTPMIRAFGRLGAKLIPSRLALWIVFNGPYVGWWAPMLFERANGIPRGHCYYTLERIVEMWGAMVPEADREAYVEKCLKNVYGMRVLHSQTSQIGTVVWNEGDIFHVAFNHPFAFDGTSFHAVRRNEPDKIYLPVDSVKAPDVFVIYDPVSGYNAETSLRRLWGETPPS